MGGVHELQLLPGERQEQRQCQQERGQTDRQTDHARPPGPGSGPAQLWPLQVCQTGPWHPCLIPISQPMSNISLPISRVLPLASPRLKHHPEGSALHSRPFHRPSHILACLILHPRAHSLHPISHTLHLTSYIPHPTFQTLHPTPHLEPGLAPYPAERQLDNVGSVAGDYPWEEEEEKEEGQKGWSQSAPRLLDARDPSGQRR